MPSRIRPVTPAGPADRRLDGDMGAGMGTVQIELLHSHRVQSFDDHLGQVGDLRFAGDRRGVAVAGVVEDDDRTGRREAPGERIEVPSGGVARRAA